LNVAVSLTRVVRFFATHRYYVPSWTPEKNREVFGALGDPPGHGHDYQCGVTVRGPLGPEGLIVDLRLLDGILQQEVLDPLHQQHLNEVIPACADGKMLPTCEALAAHLFPRIQARLPGGVVLERLRISEDATLYADCTEHTG
jgi:6-pyruvoyltetrahydropterin/6-carboxytetrahydropterin synthase